MQLSQLTAALAAIVVAVSAQSSDNTSQALPIVDLGYELHQASLYNVSRLFGNLVDVYSYCPVHWRFLQLLKHPLCRTTSRRVEVCSTSASSSQQVCSTDRLARPHLSTSRPRMAGYRGRVPPIVSHRRPNHLQHFVVPSNQPQFLFHAGPPYRRRLLVS